MGTTYRTSAGALTEQQLAMLRGLESKPIDDLEELGGYKTNSLHKLEAKGLAELGATEATITKKGLEVLKDLGKPGRGQKEPAPDRKVGKTNGAQPATAGRAGLLQDLRAQIVARYEADLAAVDRLIEIAKAVAV